MLDDTDISRTREQLLESSSDDSDSQNSDRGLENNQLVKTQSTRMASKAKCEPPSFVSNTKSYATYKADLKRWSRITGIDKKLQAEVVVYSLDGHKSGIKEKIEVAIGDKLVDNEDGINELIAFLDGIYQQDEMSKAWLKYKSFQKVSRRKNQDILNFISDFDREYNLAKTAGCVYLGTILSFRLLEAANLSENDEKFVLTAIDFEQGKKNKDLEMQMKASLKKFQGRSTVSMEGKNELAIDSAFLSQVKDVLVSQGWGKKSDQVRRRSNSNPEGLKKNSSAYKGKKNPLGEDGKPLKCFKCQSEYHLAPKCNQKNSGKKDEEKDKEETLLASKIARMLNEGSEVSCICIGIDNDYDQRDKEIAVQTGTADVTSVYPTGTAVLTSVYPNTKGMELVMVTEREEQLCLLVEDAKE